MNEENFIATLQACYFGDKNAYNKIVSIYDNLQQKVDQLAENIIGVETEKDIIHSQNLELKAQVKYYKECINQLETNKDIVKLKSILERGE